MNLANYRRREDLSWSGLSELLFELFLDFHMRDGYALLFSQRRIRVEILSNGPLDFCGVGMLPLDLVRVIRVHCAQLWAKCANYRFPCLTLKGVTLRDEFGGLLMQLPHDPFLREQRLKLANISH